MDLLAERAVHKISRYDDRTHVMMLELVDELLALDPREQAPISRAVRYGTGTQPRTVVPRPRPVVIVSVPPIASIRSRMLTSPLPP